MATIDLVRIAFRKLKAHVYFDKTALPLRDKVVEFESRNNFNDMLIEIAEVYDKAFFGRDSSLMVKILSSISVMPFPKKMKCADPSDDTVISVGNPKEKPIISELQYFIDMDVRGHILGILWILAFGKQLDEVCFENARGNRLRTKLIWDDDDNVLDSPALFEPYFAQYSLWRDDGLTCAEDMLAKGHDAMIVTLDLKRFYYRTGISREVFNEMLDVDATTKNKALHMAMFSILERYTEILRQKSVEHSGIALPIGFLPSTVLSNWCLSKFDKGILDFWNPSYYGRYVDDVIIVEKIEKQSEIHTLARANKLTKDKVIDYYLGYGRRNVAGCFASKYSQIKQRTAFSNADETLKASDDLYRVDTAFCLSKESLYEFQSKKMRVIALFADNNSTALISKFKKEIYENVSEFRLMPEAGEAFSQDDFSDFYRIVNDATINKLRGVREILMDKYELSKFLGKYRVVSSLVDDGSTKKFTRIIGKMFNGLELVENFILWERVFEIFITDKDYAGFTKFAKKVKTAIDALTVEGDKAGSIAVKSSLRRHLEATLNRVLSLVWGKKAKEIMKAICDRDTALGLLRKAYIDSRMINKYVVPIPAEVMFCPTDNCDVNLTDFTDGFRHLCKKGVAASDSSLLPYFRQAQDIASALFLQSICSCHTDCSPESNIDDYLNEISWGTEAPVEARGFFALPDGLGDNSIVSIGEQTSGKIKIAIANVGVKNVWNLENALKGRKSNRKYVRYRALAELVNAAIKEKADMLVLPENYVPIEWLPALATKAAREDLAIITGVEHIITEGNVYNYTAVILPFKYFGSIPTSAVFYQLKKHYSPEEKHLIEGYGCKAVLGTEARPLYRWRDCYFPVYCCFELADINDRAEFMSWADMVVAVEFNKDTNYFSSIVESLTRDLHCYCVQVNTSEYGDSRIAQPKRTVEQNLLMVKGGINQALLIGEIDVQALREFQIKNYALQKNGLFKPTPPGFNTRIVRGKMDHSFD